MALYASPGIQLTNVFETNQKRDQTNLPPKDLIKIMYVIHIKSKYALDLPEILRRCLVIQHNLKSSQTDVRLYATKTDRSATELYNARS
jgi:hypothetical protein